MCEMYSDPIFYLQHFWKIIWHNSPLFIICLGSLSLSVYTSSCRMRFRIKLWSQYGCIITLYRTEMLFGNTREAHTVAVQAPSYLCLFDQKNERTFLIQVLFSCWHPDQHWTAHLFPSDPVSWTCAWGLTLPTSSVSQGWVRSPKHRGSQTQVHVPGPASENKGHTKLLHSAAFPLLSLKAFRPKFILPLPPPGSTSYLP